MHSSFVSILFFLLILSSVVCAAPSLADPERTVPLQKEAVIARQIMHLGDPDDFWCNRLELRDDEADDCPAGTESYFNSARKQRVTAQTNMPRAGHILKRPGNVRVPAGIRTICDRLLPRDWVRTQLLQAGVCHKAANMTSTGGSVIRDVLRSLEGPRNRYRLQSQRLDEIKKDLIAKRPSPRSQGKLDRLAAMSYVLGLSRTTLDVAQSIDRTTQNGVGLNANLHGKWQILITALTTQRRTLEMQVIREIQRKQRQAASNSQRNSQCSQDSSSGSDGRGSPMQTRRSTFSSQFSVLQKSSLERRAVPRAGPKAAPAPSCPMKKAPPKKVIPRSEVKEKPMPTRKPRQPAVQPKPRAPSPKKKVVPRPATRPRRTPGKAAPRKRATPRTKPKTVPRPTRKPKGKARPRRGRK